MDEMRQYESSSDISNPSKKKGRKPRWWVIAIDAVVITVFALMIAVSANVIYLSSAYNMSFYVNGMSMYPTLNLDATDAHGKKLNWNRGNDVYGDVVDYGYAKGGDKDNWRAGLARYDVVITYFKSDYRVDNLGNLVRDESGNLILLPNRKVKIKRVIGLPGETVLFEPATEDTATYNRAWGKTTINPGQANEQVLTPLYGPKDYPDVGYLSYPFPTTTYGPTTLGEREYYVMGDNRGASYSSDSRDNGPILDEMIKGKAYLIVGRHAMDEAMSPASAWEYAFTPWNYRRIG